MNFGVPIRVAGASGSSSNKIAKISAWIRAKITTLDYLKEDPSIQILIQELECNDLGCVPLEVLVALLGKDARWTTKILKPLAEVDDNDVMEDVSFPSSWPYWVERYGEFQLKKSRPELYAHLQSFRTGLDQRWLMNMTETERETATRMLGRVLFNNDQFSTAAAPHNAGGRPPGSTLITMKSTPSSTRNSSSSSSSSSSSVMGSVNRSMPSGSVVVPMPTDMCIPPLPTIPPPPPSGPPPAATATIAGVFSGPLGGADSGTVGGGGPPARRHDKGVRPRGCPCCDPDNIDNIVDKMLFLETPP